MALSLLSGLKGAMKFSCNAKEMARALSTASQLGERVLSGPWTEPKKDQKIITPDNDFGHDPFGPTYGVNVPALSTASQLGERVLSAPWYEPKKDQKIITPDYDFGHDPFGPTYGVNVPLGHDGLPKFVDWSRVAGVVWPAQDQTSYCGACHIFTALGAVGSLNFIKTGEYIEPSAQHVLDCATLDKGCGGGDYNNIFDFIIKNGGILPKSAYPYVAKRGICKEIKDYGVTIDDWKPVMPNDEASLKYAVAHQPVAVSIRVDKIFMEYSKEILTGPTYRVSKHDHALLLIGYHETLWGELYWILLNSYGYRWAKLNGKVHIARGTKQKGGAYGILRSPSVPVKFSPNAVVTSRCQSCPRCFGRRRWAN